MKILVFKKIKYGKVSQSYKNDLSNYCQDINQAMEFEKEEDRLTPVLKMCISALS